MKAYERFEWDAGLDGTFEVQRLASKARELLEIFKFILNPTGL